MGNLATASIRSGAVAAAIWLAVGPVQAVAAEPPAITAQASIDRAEISDLITRYYYSLGHSSAESYTAFYTKDAEMVLVGQTFKGTEAIANAYKGMADSPQRRAYAFTITLSNLLVTVHGDTATARLIFTEFLTEKEGETPHVHAQGREYDWLVKENGHWRFKKRQIMGGNAPPADWPD